MDNVIFVDFARLSNTQGVANSAKAAKLNNATKRPNLLKKYNNQLSKIEAKTPQVFENQLASMNSVNSNNVAPQAFENQLASMTPASSNVFTEVMYPQNAIKEGGRKLKVTNMVIVKTGKRYKLFSGNIPKVQVEPKIEEPVVNEMPLPKENVAMPAFNPVPESRVNRLYRTGEIPTINENNPNGIINTPRRFAGEDNEFSYEAVHALVDDKPLTSEVSQPSPQKIVEVGAEGKKLDLINQVSHGDNGLDDIVSQTRRLKDETTDVLRQNDELKMKIERMGQDLADVQRRVKEKQNALKIKKLKEAKAAYQRAYSDNNSMTNTYKDLAEQIRKLQREEAELDQMEDDYSTGMRRAA